ncbi:MAG: hypothetical protein JNN32_14350 [Flavobacteriales bacterium]|nr:hypothetical protein [Flavobacteriales bacterium]
MRNIYTCLVLLCGTTLQAQTVLFTEGFSTGTSAFALNTTDVSSSVGGANTWLINDAYSGGSGEIECLGFPFGFTVPTTATQPAGISDPNGEYLHITSAAAINSGVENCCFAAADGLCTPASNHFAGMNTDVVTTGQGDITLSFWWLCGGGANNYGEVYYSTDGGAAWTLITAPIAQYRNQPGWVEQTITLPAFNEQASLRFGFRFVNGTSLSASDPGFGVDDVVISAAAASSSITTGTIAPLMFCQGAAVNVPFTVAGEFAPTNVFTAQLSDPSGSFSAAVALGTLPGSTAGVINAVLPANTPAGAGYRIRVVGSDPAIEGSANTANITVVASPEAGNDVLLTLCTDATVPDLHTYVDGGALNGEFYYQGLQLLPDLDVPGAYDVLYVVEGLADCPNDTALFDITVAAAPDAGTGVSTTICTYDPALALFSLLTGSPDGSGIWLDPEGAQHPGVFDPAVDAPGLYTYEVEGLAPCETDQAFIAIAVDPCVGIEEIERNTVRWLGQEGSEHVFSLSSTFAVVGIRAFDATGRAIELHERTHRTGELLRIEFHGMPTGLYFVHLEGAEVFRFVHTTR